MMDKEEMLLNRVNILSKDAYDYGEAIASALQQISELNPWLGLDLWERIIRENLNRISTDFDKEEIEYWSIGYYLVNIVEARMCSQNSFASVIENFANNSFLLEIVYSKMPISDDFFSGIKIISYLLRNERLKEADNILSAIYKNNCFKNYSKMWHYLVVGFKYGKDFWSTDVVFNRVKHQPDYIKEHCYDWIKKIPDENESAELLKFAMSMFRIKNRRYNKKIIVK